MIRKLVSGMRDGRRRAAVRMVLESDAFTLVALYEDALGAWSTSSTVAVADFADWDVRLGLAHGAESLPDAIMLGTFDAACASPIITHSRPASDDPA